MRLRRVRPRPALRRRHVERAFDGARRRCRCGRVARRRDTFSSRTCLRCRSPTPRRRPMATTSPAAPPRIAEAAGDRVHRGRLKHDDRAGVARDAHAARAGASIDQAAATPVSSIDTLLAWKGSSSRTSRSPCSSVRPTSGFRAGSARWPGPARARARSRFRPAASRTRARRCRPARRSRARCRASCRRSDSPSTAKRAVRALVFDLAVARYRCRHRRCTLAK